MRRRGRPRHPDVLTPREWEVLSLLREGLTNEQIADRLGIGVRGARYHVSEIIGKLGVANRREAAQWQPDAQVDRYEPRDAWVAAPFLLFRRGLIDASVTARVAGAGLLVVAVGAVALLAFGVTRTIGDRLTSGTQSAATLTADGGARGTLTSRAALVAFKEDGTSMSVLDPTSGNALGTIAIGYASWAIVRSSAQQLLVSQSFSAGADNAPTLRVYSLDDLSALIATVPMPDRTVATIDYPFMVLSLDERYLYYAKNRSICPSGGDAGVCDDAPSVGVIDLATYTNLPVAELPIGCNPPTLTPLGASDVLAGCRVTHEVLTRVSHDGGGTELARFPPDANGAPHAVIADVDIDGNAYIVTYDGSLVTMPALKQIALLSTSGDHLGFQTPSLLDEGTWVVAYGPNNGGYDGVLVVPRDHPEQAHSIGLPTPARFVTAWDAHSVAAIADDGSGGYVFDVASSKITSRFVVPADADVLTAR